MQTNNSHLSISKKQLTNENCLNKCPKCGASIKNSSKKTKKKDVNFLSLNLLFGDVSLKKNKKAMCDLCGARLKRGK